MEDLIKRSDAIKAFVEETNGVNVEKAIKVVDAYLQIRECDEVWDSIRAIRDCLECAKDEIAEHIPSADRPQEWIPCSERMPEANEQDERGFYKAYLVQRYNTMHTARWNGTYWLLWTIDRVLEGVTAWMPLPEPWKGAGDERDS